MTKIARASLGIALVAFSSGCGIRIVSLKGSNLSAISALPSLSSATVTNCSPTNTQTYSLTYGTTSGNYVDYCIQENDIFQSHCTFTTGTLPTTYNVSATNGPKILSVWVRDSSGAVSLRTDTNTVTLDTAAIHLSSKAIAGHPGATYNTTVTGTESLSIVFKDLKTDKTVSTQTVASNGDITLPLVAGLYRVELTNTCKTKVSYGSATVNAPHVGWTTAPASAFTYTQSPYRFAIGPSDTAIGDIDRDGYPDLVMGAGDNGVGAVVNAGIYIYHYNHATAQFSLVQTLPETLIANGVVLADLNGDGALDVVWSPWHTETIKIAFNDGAGNFGAAVSYPLPSHTATGIWYVYDIKAVDIDHDGNTDLLVSGGIYDSVGVSWNAAAVAILKNDGVANFTGSVAENDTIHWPLVSVDAFDADDDGKLDLYGAGGAPSTGVYRIMQAANGTFPYSVLNTDYYFTGPTAGDVVQWYDVATVGYLSGHNQPDVIYNNVASGGTLMTSNGVNMTLTTSLITQPTTGEQWNDNTIIADIACSGTPQIYSGLRNRALYAGLNGILTNTYANYTVPTAVNAGTAIVGTIANGTWAYTDLLMTDLDGDGKIDIIINAQNPKRIEPVFGN